MFLVARIANQPAETRSFVDCSRGVYSKDIAAELGVHPKTVSRALKRAGPPAGKRKKRGSRLDPFKPKIDKLLSENVWNAIDVPREIQEAGHDGGITILRDIIQPKRVLRPGRATVRFETKPGQQLQSDWGELRTKKLGFDNQASGKCVVLVDNE